MGIDSYPGVDGTKADAAVTGDNAGTHSAKFRGLNKIWASVWDSANSRLKVDGSAVTQPVSAASLPLPSGAAQDSTLGTTNTEIGATNETAPASDTATSGTNGRLQRIAQRLTSLIALLPTSLGQKTMANSLAITLASDQPNVPVSLSGGTVTIQNATVSIIPALARVIVTLTRPANTTRYGAYKVLADSTTAATVPQLTGSSVAGGTGLIRSITVWESSQAVPHNFVIRLYFYSSAPSAINDNAAFTIGATLPDFHIDLPPFKQSGATPSRPVTIWNGDMPYLTDASSKLYFIPVVLKDKSPISADVFTFVFNLNKS